MDRLESMHALVAAVRAGSLSAAAREQGTPLATMSRRVAELEQHLHTQLLRRTSRRLVLTDAGREYHAACQRILEEIGEAERAASGEYSTPRGNLTVTAPAVFGRMHVLPVVAEFLQSHPDVDVTLLLADRLFNLVEDSVDVALRIGDLPDSSLVRRALGHVVQVVCASPDYLARRGTLRKPADLEAHDCITFDRFFSPEAWTFHDSGREHRVSVRSRLVVNGAEAAVDAAAAGLGVTRVFSYQCQLAESAGHLVRVLQRYEPPGRAVQLVYPGQSRVPVKLRAFLDVAVPRLQERLEALS